MREIARIKAHARTTSDPEDYLLLLAESIATSEMPIQPSTPTTARTPSRPKDFTLLKEYGLYLEQLGQNQKAETVLRQAYSRDSQDDQVNAALRRVGVVPGPSVRTESQ